MTAPLLRRIHHVAYRCHDARATVEWYERMLLARWHMTDCNPTKTPCSGKLDEVLIPLQNVPATPDPALLRDYKELIGSLLFLQTGTVPEISWIVSVLARYMTTAGEPHMAAGKKILRYLKSRKTVPIQWCALTSSQPNHDNSGRSSGLSADDS